MSKGKKYCAIVAYLDLDEQRHITSLLQETQMFDVLLSTSNGTECVRQAILHQPDLVVVDAVLSNIDGLEVLRQIKFHCSRTKVLFLTSYKTLMKDPTVLSYADYSILMPCYPELLATRAISLVRASLQGEFSVPDILDQATAQLSFLNAPRHLKGYLYIRDGILLSVLDPDILYHHTGPNGLYAQLCRRHQKSYQNIERCMRTVSDKIFQDSLLFTLEQCFPANIIKKGHISNIALISILASRVTDMLRILKNRQTTDN